MSVWTVVVGYLVLAVVVSLLVGSFIHAGMEDEDNEQ
jgi:hypothetical protein